MATHRPATFDPPGTQAASTGRDDAADATADATGDDDDGDDDGDGRVAVAPEDVYHERVGSNPRICNNCFRRYKDVYDPPGEAYWREHAARTHNGWSTESLRDVVATHTIRATTDGAVVNAAPATTWRGEPECRGRPAWGCEACGVIDGVADMTPRETSAFLETAERLFDRLAEQDIDVAEEAFFATARAYKTDPDHGGTDYENYERAVAAGVRGRIDRPGV